MFRYVQVKSQFWGPSRKRHKCLVATQLLRAIVIVNALTSFLNNVMSYIVYLISRQGATR